MFDNFLTLGMKEVIFWTYILCNSEKLMLYRENSKNESIVRMDARWLFNPKRTKKHAK